MKRVLFWLTLTVGACALLTGASWWLYGLNTVTPNAFVEDLAGRCLQLALIVILGGSIKMTWDWRADARRVDRETRAQSESVHNDVAKRLRNLSVQLHSTRVLLRSEDNAKAYIEHLRTVMGLNSEAEDLLSDVQASRDILVNGARVENALESLISYLTNGAEEYQWAYKLVTEKWPQSALVEVVAKADLAWLRDFITQGDGFIEVHERLATAKRDVTLLSRSL